MINMLFIILCLLGSHVNHKVEGIQNTLKEDLELHRQLKLINKHSVKTITTEFGDIIDCIDIYKQPAFDHPLLKDHKLQKKPNIQNITEESTMKNLPIGSMFGLGKDECPTRTVPILRTTKDDFMLEKSLLNDDLVIEKSLLNDHMLVQDLPGVHLAEVSLLPHYGPYYGVSGINTIYKPKVDTMSQISMSHLWLQNGPIGSTNKISAGWHVVPQLYGDYATRFYISWTSDNFQKTGCYNIRCAGFIQTNKAYYLGGRMANVSKDGGPTFEFMLSISQDPVTKNWWLAVRNIAIGYFPAKLFSNMNSASEVGWGGRTRTHVGTPSPQMGSGYFPDGVDAYSCYFRFVSIQDASRKTRGPGLHQTHSFSDKPHCYGVQHFGDEGGYYGNFIQFGGPGGNCGD